MAKTVPRSSSLLIGETGLARRRGGCHPDGGGLSRESLEVQVSQASLAGGG